MIMGAGIAAEFNPFHKGHSYIIEKARQSGDFVGAVMSGCFVQRGEPAVSDKLVRTKTALAGGADIVFELPAIYASGSADVFAFGCCDLLTKAGIFDKMVFGHEEDEPEHIEKVGILLSEEPPEFKALIKKYSATGLGFPAAREKAVRQLLELPDGVLSLPNNILAAEYIKYLHRMKSPVKPVGIRRIRDGFSASAARKALIANSRAEAVGCMSEDIAGIYFRELERGVVCADSFREEIRYEILRLGKSGLREICDVTEGLENKIYENCSFENTEGLVGSLKSKRYTAAKLRRCIMHILLGIKKEDAYPPKGVPYIRVLGVRREKRYILGELSERAQLPVVINVKKDMEHLDSFGRRCLEKDIFATDLYMLKSRKNTGADYTNGLIVL